MGKATENPVRDKATEIHQRYGLERVIPSNTREIIANLNIHTFADVVPRLERSGFDFHGDRQSDDATSPEIHRSALLTSIEQAGEILIPVEVDEEGHLLDGFRRVAIAHALNLEEIPVVVLKGWWGDPAQVLEQKRSYIREINTTARVLGLHDRKDLARKLLGEDEQRFGAGEVASRQSYGLIAAQTGLSQHTVEDLEKAHYYLRYRARCEGEQRLRGDGRLRATTPIPPEGRLDEQDAWGRGFPDDNRKRSLAGLQEAAGERRLLLGKQPQGPERQEREALLEDALAVLSPRMIALDREREETKKQQEVKAQEAAATKARREAEVESARRRQTTEGQPAGTSYPASDAVIRERLADRPDARTTGDLGSSTPAPAQGPPQSGITPRDHTVDTLLGQRRFEFDVEDSTWREEGVRLVYMSQPDWWIERDGETFTAAASQGRRERFDTLADAQSFIVRLHKKWWPWGRSEALLNKEGHRQWLILFRPGHPKASLYLAVNADMTRLDWQAEGEVRELQEFAELWHEDSAETEAEEPARGRE